MGLSGTQLEPRSTKHALLSRLKASCRLCPVRSLPLKLCRCHIGVRPCSQAVHFQCGAVEQRQGAPLFVLAQQVGQV